MKSRKFWIYMIPLVLCALHMFKNGDFVLPQTLINCEGVNVFEWVLRALQETFGISIGDTSQSMIMYVAWFVTYSIVFEIGMIMLNLVVFLPKVVEKMINRIAGEKDE